VSAALLAVPPSLLAQRATSAEALPRMEPAPPSWSGDEQTADSLYRVAQDALSRGDYRRAATLFGRVADRYPRTRNAPGALYMQAFALSRTGSTADLRSALETLEALADRYPSSDAHRGDAPNLRIRVCGELARQGDARCAQEVATAATPPQGTRSCPDPDDENDERIMALNALLNMNAESALPLLERTLDRRDECSAGLRRKAVFLVSTKGGSRAADILLRVARQDPSAAVREDAIFWLGQTRDPRVVDVLADIVERSDDNAMREKAIFSLTQTRSERGSQVLRTAAENTRLPANLRENAIFWLGQQRSTGNMEFLRGLYGRLTDQALKEKVIFSLSQQRGLGNEEWVLAIALDERESVQMRKSALFWAGQQRGMPVASLAGIYDRMRDAEMKEQAIFVLTQRREPEAVDKLMDIARRDPDRQMRSKAIFWLGQSRDPRVLRFLEELINK
jgi:HEAT repeat protein